MSNVDLDPLLDELERHRKRADEAERRAEQLKEALHWLANGVRGFLNDWSSELGDPETSTVVRDDVPLRMEDVRFAAHMFSLRHGSLLAFACLRDDAPQTIRDVANITRGELDLNAHDLARQSERDMANLVSRLHERGVEALMNREAQHE